MLQTRKTLGEILWWRRLQTGLFYTRSGTPVNIGGKSSLEDGKDLDLIAIISRPDGGYSILFIDTKASGKNGFSYEQQVFVDSMKRKPRVLCATLNDPEMLPKLIEQAKNLP